MEYQGFTQISRQMDKSRTPFLPVGTTDIDEVVENQKEINESPETRSRCLEELRQELKSISDIDPCLEDSFLLGFLRISKFDTQKALQRVLRYYKQCDVLLDAYQNCSLPLHKAGSLNHLFVSPRRLKNNSFLLIGLSSVIDYRRCKMADIFYLEVLAMSEMLRNPVNQICGVTLIFDYAGFDFHALLRHTPGWVRLFVNFLLNAAPCRLKALHIVNAPTIFSSVFNIAYPFLPSKIQGRVFFHSKRDEWQNLHASIPCEILPKQYGGKISDDKLISCLQDFEEAQENFLKSFVYGSIKNQHRRKRMKVIL